LEAVDKGSLTYFRKWVIQKYHKKFYKRVARDYGDI
jgi:hypothetical protein